MRTGRPPTPPSTLLGAAIRRHRGTVGQVEAAKVIGIPRGTLASVELGLHLPSTGTALRLARWLGWPLEQVVEAAGQPAGQ